MSKRIYLHIASLLLILLTIQNAMGELYFHDIEHEPSNIGYSVFHHYDGDGHEHIVNHCTCLHDFTIPIGTSDTIIVPFPPITYLQVVQNTFVFHLSKQRLIDATFRGPPSYLHFS